MAKNVGSNRCWFDCLEAPNRNGCHPKKNERRGGALICLAGRLLADLQELLVARIISKPVLFDEFVALCGFEIFLHHLSNQAFERRLGLPAKFLLGL